MGMNKYTHVGPYVKFPVKPVSVVREFKGVDEGQECSEAPCFFDSSFCSICGKKGDNFSRKVQEENGFHRIVEEAPWNISEDRLSVAKEHDGFQYLTSNALASIKSEESPVALDATLIEEMVAKFKIEHADELRGISEYLGEEPKVCFGAITYWS